MLSPTMIVNGNANACVVAHHLVGHLASAASLPRPLSPMTANFTECSASWAASACRRARPSIGTGSTTASGRGSGGRRRRSRRRSRTPAAASAARPTRQLDQAGGPCHAGPCRNRAAIAGGRSSDRAKLCGGGGARRTRDPDTSPGREVAVSNPRKVLFPQAGPHQARSRPLLHRRRRRRAARRPAAGRTCWCAIPTASTASSSTRSARPSRGRRGSRSSSCRFRPAAPRRRSCRATPPRWSGWPTSPASSCIRIRCAPTISIIPTSCASISIRCRASTWPQIREVAGVVRATLADLGLVGWPKTSGSRGIHIYVRIERRWTFTEVRRAALALAREVERRAPALATSKWWKEERHGVFLDYNQNAKDRTIAAAYSVRPKPDARVSAPLAWDEVERLRARPTSRWRRCRRGLPTVGDRHRGIDRAAGQLDALLELSARQEREGLGDAPWPPHYRKQPGEAPRVAPSKRRVPKHPLIEIGRAREKADALAGLERWKARHPEAARAPRAGRRARGRDARPLPHVDAHPRQPAARAGGAAAGAGGARPRRGRERLADRRRPPADAAADPRRRPSRARTES